MDFTYGGKVKINLDKFTGKKLSDKFSEFINTNKNTIFTSRVDRQGGYKHMYFLEEDANDPKFLFWEGDLIFLDEIK